MNGEIDRVVDNARREAFEAARGTSRPSWDDRRRLWSEGWLNKGYNESLPTWKGKAFSDIVEARISAGLIPVRILDVGSGLVARFLQDCKEQWRTAVEVYGINVEVDWDQVGSLTGISVVDGDAQRLLDYYQPESMDVVVSNKVFSYLADPWGTLEAAHKVLRNGGVAMVTHVPLTPVIEGLKGNEKLLQRLVRFMKGDLGMEVRTFQTTDRGDELHTECDVSFQKFQRAWSLPLSYSGRTNRQCIEWDKIDEQYFDVWTLTYLIDETLMPDAED